MVQKTYQKANYTSYKLTTFKTPENYENHVPNSDRIFYYFI